MDFLFKYNQEKRDKKSGALSSCDLKLFNDDKFVTYVSKFDFNYHTYGLNRFVVFEHTLSINTTNGDITTNYKISNNGMNVRTFNNVNRTKKNNFLMLNDLIENGLVRGEKRLGYWGVKYRRAIETIMRQIGDILKTNLKTEFYKNKVYPWVAENTFYERIVDFHLDMKNIKGHNGVYKDIQCEYPKKKWLKLNDNKFLPSVLDYYGIKSKYLIGELNKNWGKPIYISSLNYLCRLFGDNHIEYLKQFDWDYHCYDLLPNKKVHELKNDAEKKALVQIIKKWEKDSLRMDGLIISLNRLFSIREFLETKNVSVKFKGKNDSDFDNMMESWSSAKNHITKGYKMRYVVPEDFKSMIEENITVGDDVYTPRLLLTEEEFRIEGYEMKNCMSKQFSHGIIYFFVSMRCNRKKINLQYRKGNLIQSYAKANTVVPDTFDKAISVLTNRFKGFQEIVQIKEKYDIISD